MLQLTDIFELKRILEIDPNDNAEDVNLNFYIEWASTWIQEFLNRDLEYRSRTEYYAGTGTSKLRLRSRPVCLTDRITGLDVTPAVYLDESAWYGSANNSFNAQSQLTYGRGFCLDIDQPDGTSRSGLLIKINGLWPKPAVRYAGFLSPSIGESFGTIKVVYSAGYTTDSLPSQIRTACNMLAARMRYVMPIGLGIGSDSYEEMGLGFVEERKDYLMSLVKPILFSFRNWNHTTG